MHSRRRAGVHLRHRTLPAVGVVLVVASASGAGNASDAAGAAAARRFAISGSVSGLYPGDKSPLVLTVSNPFMFGITVTSITTKISNAAIGCGASYLSVANFSGHLPVAADGTARLAVTVSLLHTAPDACQGATFVLHYAGTATRT